MRSKAIFCAAWAVWVIGMGATAAAYADTVRWRSSVAHVTAEGKDLKDVLRDLLASQGVTASIADNVQGTVTGRFDMAPQRILDTLAATFGFVWFYDGSVMSISNANDVTRQIVRLDNASIADLNATLRGMRLDDKRYPLTYDSSARTVIISGPPQYVQMVAGVAKHLDENMQRSNGTVVRAFKLSSAWAADHKVQLDGKNVVVPGVATVVSNLYHSRQSGAGGNNAAPAIGGLQRLSPMTDASGGTTGGSPVPPLPPGMAGGGDSSRSLVSGLLGGGQPGSARNGAITDDASQGGAAGATAGDQGAGDLSLPVVEADPTTNSVLIRDTPQRIGLYAPLIEKLDSRPNLIEIEAHIIEIDDDLLRQIGVDWRAHNSHVDLQTGSGTLQQNGYNGNINPNFGVTTLPDGTTSVAATPVGGAITAVLGNAGRYLLARITALESTSEARIDSSPKVATLDNVEAVMDNKTRFFVRVQGYTSGDLYSVSTGTSLRVLPMVVQDNGATRIKLDVHIEDGQLTGDTVDTLPVITSSEINTQAFVGEGESLLIAGYSTDKDSNGVARVPWLSKIPLVGALFRNTDRSHKHMERVFLLTPRIIHF
ncbi:type III secretion system outer membrane ring subunit SctC [Burkholderia vietnamiensis]|uniref:type III secretion system outer membrane ring subunit SctC n=1 Tax=Burkholderia vietnamiensis TaxID=60552 RepID=UPI001B934268|nr:type III secretion system outer membrane ring subunit SctC [Burkholderia vietnamiensis]MBR8218586.1 type III secretion system outer membrane ring subunit SctC [Burkholderia vietnamiensis]MCA8181174.1 type III secretion system outer membrane ring subunit SctC [Burkholderia vietnamiensis]